MTPFVQTSVRAQTSSVAVQVSGKLATRVTAVMAERWQVEPSRVVLQWGHVRNGTLLDVDTPFDIRGRVAGTNFTVVFFPNDTQPLAVGLRAGLRKTVPLTTRPLPTGYIIAEADVTWGDWTFWGDDVHERPGDGLPIGWRVRSSIAAGRPVRSPFASAPPLVGAGADVEVIWEKRSIAILLVGVAMHAASVGQHVRVRLNQGRGNVRGLVKPNGQIELSRN